MSAWGAIGSFLKDNMDWIAPVAGAGAAYYGASSGPGSQETIQTNNEPWTGLQPYLVGGDPVPSWVTSRPQVSDAYSKWNDRLSRGAEGSWLDPAPPMYAGGSQTPPVAPQAISPPPVTQYSLRPTIDAFGNYTGNELVGGGGTGTPSPVGDWNSLSPEEKAQAVNDLQTLGYISPGVLGALPGGLSALGVPGLNSLADFFGVTVPGYLNFDSDYSVSEPGFGGGGYADRGGYDGRGGGTAGGGFGGADSGVGGGPGGENESGAASGGR